jgi:PAS domain S-box-containing protein
MGAAVEPSPAIKAGEMHDLFYQRTCICLWLGVVFFSLFALLDFICCRPYFGLFFTYRLVSVLFFLCCLQILTYPEVKPHARSIMSAAMLLGALAISLMTVQLGGYVSDYYVGILLMIAGGFSVLPLNVAQALLLGGSTYLVYVLTVYLGTAPLDDRGVVYLVNNSFFFFSIVVVTAVQCFDEMQTHLKSLRAKKNLQAMSSEFKHYNDNLEELVRLRMALLEESDLKFRDLYNNILDLVVLIDQDSVLRMVNPHGAVLLEGSPEGIAGKVFTDFVAAQDRGEFSSAVLSRLHLGEEVRGVQLQLRTSRGRHIEVEVSGNRVEMFDSGEQYQLIIRDITVTKEMEKKVLASHQLIDTSRQAAIFGLSRLAECRDENTGAHLRRIREYTRILATELAGEPDLEPLLTAEFIEELCLSSVLHDIGKVGIPDAILLKPGRLTEAEFAAMKRHCEYGSIALSSSELDTESFSFLRMGQEITRFHHERWDGSGYPSGLAGVAIPLAARIVALADVYDALTSSRSYKPAYSHEQARTLIVEESGGHFDPSIVSAFLKREQQFKHACPAPPQPLRQDS